MANRSNQRTIASARSAIPTGHHTAPPTGTFSIDFYKSAESLNEGNQTGAPNQQQEWRSFFQAPSVSIRTARSPADLGHQRRRRDQDGTYVNSGG